MSMSHKVYFLESDLDCAILIVRFCSKMLGTIFFKLHHPENQVFLTLLATLFAVFSNQPHPRLLMTRERPGAPLCERTINRRSPSLLPEFKKKASFS